MKKLIVCDDMETLATQEPKQLVAKESELIQGEFMDCPQVENNNYQKSNIATSKSRENQPQKVVENDLYMNKTNINKNNRNHNNLIYPIHHTNYVMDCMQNVTTKIGNIKAYLITALYNAPNTMNHYYQQEVQWDRYAC